MRIVLVQQNYHIGNFEANGNKIIEAIKEAKQEGADLVVFSELSICGYPPRDFLEFNDYIEKCTETLQDIAQHATDIGVIVGGPARNPIKEGKDLFNAAFLLYEGAIIGEVHKTLLPTYDIFDENRYFEPAYAWDVLTFKGKKIALTICEDIWNLGDNPLYRICPMDMLAAQKPDIMINISASPFDYDHDEARKAIVQANVRKYGLPMIYCNTVGSQTEVVFDGGSLVYNASGQLVAELAYFKEDLACVDIEWKQEPQHPTISGKINNSHWLNADLCTVTIVRGSAPAPVGPGPVATTALEYLKEYRNIAQIHQALILGIRDYFNKMGFKKAILGSSGGLDSAVTLALACEALGAENVLAVLMPSPYSSDHSIEDAVTLSENLQNPYKIVPIRTAYEAVLDTVQPIFGDLPFSLAEENMQSRTRGNILMSIANKFNYILLNTSNKSELAAGYGTLYGDMAGGISVLGDVYKVQVYALAEYMNRGEAIIPVNILTKAPSAELRPEQKDSDSLPPYEVLDQILFHYIERRMGPAEITRAGFEQDLVESILRMVNKSEFKRNQFCPIIRVSTKAFGVGRRMPIVGKYLC